MTWEQLVNERIARLERRQRALWRATALALAVLLLLLVRQIW